MAQRRGAAAAGGAPPPPPPPPPPAQPAAAAAAGNPVPQPVRAWAVPQKFSGDRHSDWNTWYMQFQTVARVNGWTVRDQSSYLALYLTDDALSYYHSLDGATRQGPLQPLVRLLEQRFGAAQNADVLRAEFKSRRQRPTEALSEYCEAIRRIARQAYPAVQRDVQDMLAKDQFLSGIDSREIRVEVRKLNPISLDAALQCALQIEAVHNAECSQDIPVAPQVCAVQPPSMNELLAKVVDRLDKLESRLDSSENHKSAQQPQPRGTGSRRRCFVCESLYHLARDCPHGQRPASSQSQAGNRQ